MSRFLEEEGITIWHDEGFCWQIQHYNISTRDVVTTEAATKDQVLAIIQYLFEEPGR